jgi:GAF domain-containing protein
MARLSRDPMIPEFLPPHWRDVLSAMTARDPAHRPTGQELVSLLRQTVIADSARHKDSEGDTCYPTDPHLSAGRSAILDTIPDEALHRVTAMGARLFSAPIAIESVVDHDRTWFRSHYGPDVEQIALDVDLRTARIPNAEPVIIEDGESDPRSQDSHRVTGPLGLRFSVGVPLKRTDGQTIGTLSVLDFTPRSASAAEVANRQDLAALVVAQLETRHEGLRNGGDDRPDGGSLAAVRTTDRDPVSLRPTSPSDRGRISGKHALFARDGNCAGR